MAEVLLPDHVAESVTNEKKKEQAEASRVEQINVFLTEAGLRCFVEFAGHDYRTAAAKRQRELDAAKTDEQRKKVGLEFNPWLAARAAIHAATEYGVHAGLIERPKPDAPAAPASPAGEA